MMCVIWKISSLECKMEDLDADFSLLEEEYYGERLEEQDSDNSCSENESSGDDGAVGMIEPRDLDVKEVETVQQFMKETCGCSKKQGGPCSTYFNETELAEIRMSMAELENDQLDLVILSQINAHHYSGRLEGHRTASELSQKSERERDYTYFFCKGHNICLKSFLFIHNNREKTFS